MVSKKKLTPLTKLYIAWGYTLSLRYNSSVSECLQNALPGEPFFLGRCQSSEPNKGMSVRDGDGGGSANLHGGM